MTLRLWALGGESISAPEDTLPAYWNAIVEGADGIVITLQLSKDNEIVCCRHRTLKETCDDDRPISKVNAEELATLDAGARFQSTVLNDNLQASSRGADFPWVGKRKHQRLYHPRLEEVLLLLSRRSQLILQVDSSVESRIDALLKALKTLIVRFIPIASIVLLGDTKTILCAQKLNIDVEFALRGEANLVDDQVSAKELSCAYLHVDMDQVLDHTGSLLLSDDERHDNDVPLILCTSRIPQTFSPQNLETVKKLTCVPGIICQAIRDTQRYLTPVAQTVHDDFTGSEVNQKLWACGYSQVSRDATITQDDGLIIDLKEGDEYAGAAALSTYAIVGNFSAKIDFEVANPFQGTTFELAVIQIDPGYHNMNNENLSRRKVNLTFDVHGAAPYVSSECDEENGYRIGWNNGPALASFDARFNPSSSNIYNKYSRDVGEGATPGSTGCLMLTRNRGLFSAYYQDKNNAGWVLSGVASVPTLCDEVFIRIAAKHWPKRGNTPPSNKIVFRRYRLEQY